jgi:hypothetical protein
MDDPIFLQAVQNFLANALSISTVRRMGPSGTLEAIRTFLKGISLADVNKTKPSNYAHKLDDLTKNLQSALPKPGHWGVARKCLNLFFRDALYNFYLRQEFDLTVFEKHLEIPLDSFVGRALRKEAEGCDLPRWQSVIGLDAESSARFQDVAARVAKRKGTERVHLDMLYWRPLSTPD